MQISRVEPSCKERKAACEKVLIISPGGVTPPALQEMLEQMEVYSRNCTTEEAEDILRQDRGFQALIGVVRHRAELEAGAWQDVLAECEKHNLAFLALTGEKDAEERAPAAGAMIIWGQANESREMLKGRLATLRGLHAPWQQMRQEMKRLQMVTGPANQYINQLDEEMRLAARLQQDFLPKRLPELPGLRFSVIYRPATFVSGDIYDVMRLDEEHVGFYIADAVGHGMPAALLTMFIKRAMITKIIEGNQYHLVEPGAALVKLNEDLVAQQMSNFQFATCCYGILNCTTLRLRIASAGHPAPMLIRRDAESTELNVSGSLLGVFPEQQYETQVYQLHAGEKLLLYSDGVEVAFVNEGPDQPLRFRKEFGNLAGYDIDAMCRKLMDIINREEGSLHPRDDVTIVGLELRGENRLE